MPPAASAFLLDKATEHDAKALRVLGRRVLEVIDPAAAHAEEARRLEADEADARATAFLTWVDDGHGRTPRAVQHPHHARRDCRAGLRRRSGG